MADLSRLTLSELAVALAPRDYYTPEQAAQAFERVGFSDAGQGRRRMATARGAVSWRGSSGRTCV